MKLTAEKRMKDYCGDYPIRIVAQEDGIGINLMSGIWELETAKEFVVKLQQLIEDIETVNKMDEAVIADSVRGGGEPCNATISRERDGAGARPVSEGGVI